MKKSYKELYDYINSIEEKLKIIEKRLNYILGQIDDHDVSKESRLKEIERLINCEEKDL